MKKNRTFNSSVFALLATSVSLAFRASFSAKNEVPKEEAERDVAGDVAGIKSTSFNDVTTKLLKL